jgi:hypothetical protein
MEDVDAWITLMEDQFILNGIVGRYKVVNVSPLLEGDVRLWYAWPRKELDPQLLEELLPPNCTAKFLPQPDIP